MPVSQRVRKFALTAHVVTSVGWLGAVFAFLALAISGITQNQAVAVRGAYVAMASVTWAVIVPLCLASLVTGLVEGVATPWGLFRHYWVALKLAMTLLATLLLFVHTQPIDQLAEAASSADLGPDVLRHVRLRLIIDAVLAIVALLVTTALGTYKPGGPTRYGRGRKRDDASRLHAT